MRKKVFALMLSSAILSPLFAMDLPEEKKAGLGDLRVLPINLVKIDIIQKLPVINLASLSGASKTFYELSASNDFWKPLSIELGFSTLIPLW